MSDIWLPGYERWPLGLPGLVYDETSHPKCVWHSTEGSSVEGAVDAYRPYPPQLIVDPVRRRRVQHIPLNRGGYSLGNSEADDEFAIQVEVVGFAERMPSMPEDQLRWLGEEVARPLHEIMGVPYVVIRHGFRAPGGGIILARPDSPIRISLAEMRNFSGHMAHQHVPGDDHWDIGGLRIGRVLEYAQEDDVTAQDVWFGMKIGFPGEKYTDFPGVWLPSIDKHASEIRHRLVPRQITLLEQILVAVTGDDVTLDELRQVSREQVPLIVEGINAGLLPVLADALRQVQDMDNLDEAKRTAAELLRLIAERAPSAEDDTDAPAPATT